MAARQRTTAYRVNGSAAYAPVYSGNTVRNPRKQEVQRTVPHRNQRPTVETRPQANVRQAGQVAPFAVIGFLAVGVFAVLLLLSTLQLHIASNEVASLRNQLTELQTEQAALSARYEQEFDLQHLQAAVGGTMIRPTADQITYIDMSRPDSVEVFGDSADSGNVFSGLIEYFC